MSAAARRDRAALVVQLRLSLAAAATAWAAMWSWRGFTLEAAGFLVPLVLVALAVALTGALTRWRHVPGPLVVMAQVVVGGALTCQLVASRPFPGDRFWAALSSATDAANTYASPVPRTEEISVLPLLLVGGLVAVLLVDLCAVTLRRAPLAGLPLLTVYSVPISLLDRGLSWWVFAATAVGFLVVLFLQEEEHLSRWGRSLDGNTQPVRRLSDSVRGSALSIGAIATAAAVLLPVVIPTFSFSVFDVGPGDGGDGDIKVTNPMVDLRQDLVREDDVPLVTVTTDDPSPDHLRISVLNRFTDNEWSAGNRKVPSSNLARGAVPFTEGEPGRVQYTPYDYQVQVSDAFDSRWLPTQAPVSAVDAEGDWRFDPDTVDFLASDDDLDTRGLSYTMTAQDPRYDTEGLLSLDTSTSAVPDELTELPTDLDDSIRVLATAETQGARSDFQRAVLLNQFFRETGGFRYRLPTSPEDGVGTGELADFLSTEGRNGRTGYCEQFAAAMAVMARELDIPARVAVGFLSPTRVEGTASTWVYSSHDLHAWTELYFPQVGWVLFDPTPDSRTGDSQPAYADARVDTVVPTEEPTTAPTSEPVRPTDRPSASAPTQAPDQAAPEADAGGDGASFPWRPLLVTLLVVALVAFLVALPRLLRSRQRERRLAGGPESAWDEVRATVVDLRLRWPEGRSPRETRTVLVRWFGGPGDDALRPAHGPERDPAATAALDRLVAQLERVRYARAHAVEPGSLADDVRAVTAALVAGAGPRLRRRARWLPASAFQRRRVTDDASPRGRDPRPAEPELVGGGGRTEVL